MLRHSSRRIPHATLAGASLLALALGVGAFPRIAAAWPVGQEETVTLDDFTITAKDASNNTVGTYSGAHSLVFEGAGEASQGRRHRALSGPVSVAARIRVAGSSILRSNRAA